MGPRDADEGYDDAQRAELREVEDGGPDDGLLITDLDPDMGDAEEDAIDGIAAAAPLPDDRP